MQTAIKSSHRQIRFTPPLKDDIKVDRIPNFERIICLSLNLIMLKNTSRLSNVVFRSIPTKWKGAVNLNPEKRLRTPMVTMKNLRLERKQKHTDCWSWLFLCFGKTTIEAGDDVAVL
ncbi:unnamed protein product [Arabidopsis thaliana]|uniref:Uncharacterized protein n=1 Tax=Arabidopsis thaliana TaxID=3702 RepID=A0A5S9WPC6_ARATH|nr:unnamed protein product [Arabidopsis thaliana]